MKKLFKNTLLFLIISTTALPVFATRTETLFYYGRINHYLNLALQRGKNYIMDNPIMAGIFGLGVLAAVVSIYNRWSSKEDKKDDTKKNEQNENTKEIATIEKDGSNGSKKEELIKKSDSEYEDKESIEGNQKEIEENGYEKRDDEEGSKKKDLKDIYAELQKLYTDCIGLVPRNNNSGLIEEDENDEVREEILVEENDAIENEKEEKLTEEQRANLVKIQLEDREGKLFPEETQRIIALSMIDGFLKEDNFWNEIRPYNLVGHTNLIRAAKFSPDSRYFATGSWDKTIKIWDVRTAKLLYDLPIDFLVESIVFSPKGEYFAAGLLNGTIKIWNTKTWEVVCTLTDHRKIVSSMVFSKNGKYLAACGAGAVVVWDITAWKPVYCHNDGYLVYDVKFSPDGKYFAEGLVGSIKILSTDTWDIKTTLAGEKNSDGYLSSINSVEFSPNGTYFTAIDYHGIVKTWKTNKWEVVYSYANDKNKVATVAFSPDDKYLAENFDNGTVCVLDTVEWAAVKDLNDLLKDFNSVEFSSDGKYLIGYFQKISSVDICLWDTTGWKVARTLTDCTNDYKTAVFSPDGKYLSTCYYQKVPKIWHFYHPVKKWIEDNVVPLQANLIARSCEKNKEKKSLEIKSSTDDAKTWITFPEDVRSHLELSLKIKLLPAEKKQALTSQEKKLLDK